MPLGKVCATYKVYASQDTQAAQGTVLRGLLWNEMSLLPMIEAVRVRLS